MTDRVPCTGRESCRSRRRTGLDELIDDRIHQRLERSIDDVRRDTDRGPAFTGLVLTLDENTGDRAGAAVENTHAIVGQLEAFDITLILAEILAQGHVERIDRTIALACRYQGLAVDPHLDDG